MVGEKSRGKLSRGKVVGFSVSLSQILTCDYFAEFQFLKQWFSCTGFGISCILSCPLASSVGVQFV